MGNIRLGIQEEIAIALRDAMGLDWLVETGTYKGGTTRWAAQNFDKVVTIEVDKSRHTKTRAGMPKSDYPNVKFCLGDSGKRLGKELNYRKTKPALLWLDAHWSGKAGTGDPNEECPLRDELEAVRDFDAIMIDDARLFLQRPIAPHDPLQWPTFDEIKAMLPGRYFVVHEDVIIAVPSEYAHVVRKVVGGFDIPQFVVLTSNDYIAAVRGFVYFWLRFAGHEYPVKVVRYDVPPAPLPHPFSQFAIGKQDEYTWSQGLIKYLNYHNYDHLILMLEDYWLSKKVTSERLLHLWQMVQSDPKIAKIDLTNDRLKFGHSDWEDGMVVSEQDALFQTSIQAAIWRKDVLLQFLHESENPWQFEKKGTKRMIAARKSGDFDGLVLGTKTPVIEYVNAVGGEGNKPGVLDRSKVPPWMLSALEEANIWI